MTQPVVRVNFFGLFRKYIDHDTLSFPAGSSVEELKALLAKHLSGKVDSQLIHDSAIACNDVIVASDYKVKAGEIVSILPPVCGG